MPLCGRIFLVARFCLAFCPARNSLLRFTFLACLPADGLTSDALLLCAALTKFPCVVRLFQLNYWAVPLTSGWARRRSVRSCTSSRFLRSEFCQDFCRPRKPAGRCFQGVRRIRSRQTKGRCTLHRGSGLRHRLAQSHQKAMCLRPNLSTLPAYL